MTVTREYFDETVQYFQALLQRVSGRIDHAEECPCFGGQAEIDSCECDFDALIVDVSSAIEGFGPGAVCGSEAGR